MKLSSQATFASSQGNHTCLCPPGDCWRRALPQGLLCLVPFESPHPGSCRRELLLQGVYSAVSSCPANLVSSCQCDADLALKQLQVSCGVLCWVTTALSAPAALCTHGSCVGWHSVCSMSMQAGIPNPLSSLVLQTEPGRTHRMLFPLAAKGQRAFQKCWWHCSLQSFLKPGHLFETKLCGVSDEELSGADSFTLPLDWVH